MLRCGEPFRDAPPIKADVSADAEARHRVRTTGAGLFSNPSDGDFQTLSYFVRGQNIGGIKRETSGRLLQMRLALIVSVEHAWFPITVTDSGKRMFGGTVAALRLAIRATRRSLQYTKSSAINQEERYLLGNVRSQGFGHFFGSDFRYCSLFLSHQSLASLNPRTSLG